jgi:hypothetical protein
MKDEPIARSDGSSFSFKASMDVVGRTFNSAMKRDAKRQRAYISKFAACRWGRVGDLNNYYRIEMVEYRSSIDYTDYTLEQSEMQLER